MIRLLSHVTGRLTGSHFYTGHKSFWCHQVSSVVRMTNNHIQSSQEDRYTTDKKIQASHEPQNRHIINYDDIKLRMEPFHEDYYLSASILASISAEWIRNHFHFKSRPKIRLWRSVLCLFVIIDRVPSIFPWFLTFPLLLTVHFHNMAW